MKTALIVGGVVVAAAAAYVAFKKKPGESFFYGAGELAAHAAYDAVDGVVSTVTYSIGDALGVPRTDKTACQKAKEAGDTWEASFACPAGDFLSYWWDK